MRYVLSGLALAYIGYLSINLLGKVGRRMSIVQMMMRGQHKSRIDWAGMFALIAMFVLVWLLGRGVYGEILALLLVAAGLLVEEYRTKGDYRDLPDIIRIYEVSLTKHTGELRESLYSVRSRLMRTSVQQALDESLTRLALGSQTEQGLQPLKEQSGYLAAYIDALRMANWQKSTALDSLLIEGIQRLSREMRNPLSRLITFRLAKVLRLAVLGGLISALVQVLPEYPWKWLAWVLGIALVGAITINGLLKQPLLRRTAFVAVLAVFMLIANGRLSINSVKAETTIVVTPTAPVLYTPTAPRIVMTVTAMPTPTATVMPTPTAPRVVTAIPTQRPTEREERPTTPPQPTEAHEPTPTAPPLEKPTAPGIP